MQESYDEGLASHIGPESCAVVCKGQGEALTGVRAGGVLSCENRTSLTGSSGSRRRPGRAEGESGCIACARCSHSLRGQRPLARTETPRTGIGRSSGRLPIRGGRIGKSKDVSR
jgi:hypothetical protein